MNILSYLMESRGPINAMHRLPKIAQRFGVSPAKIERALDKFVSISERYGCTPTLTVTAAVLARNARFFNKLQERAELAVHGYVHTDYSLLSEAEQAEHMERALAAFHHAGISPSGFRCPYFRWNVDSVKVAARAGLKYGSNGVVAWDVVPEESVQRQAWHAYQKGLRLYDAHWSAERLNLPWLVDGILLDIPASLPDDEAIVDRLGLGKTRGRDEIWPRMLERIYDEGELFTLSLHNERVPICAAGLDAVLERARRLSPPVWVAPMREIADWWQRRAQWRLSVNDCGDGTFRVIAPAEEDVTVLGRGLGGEAPGPHWFAGYRQLRAGTSLVHSEKPPVIEVEDRSSPALVSFLEGEGFAVTRTPGGGGVRIEGYESFGESDKRPVLDLVEGTSAPLVRLWRWPNGARAALAITGDIDSMTLIDFFRRPFEV